MGLEHISPLWGRDPQEYMNWLIDTGFRFVITSVSSGGLDDSWLGRVLSKGDLPRLIRAANRHGFDPSFEGGEAETFVIDSPLFLSRIDIVESARFWGGYRGWLEIVDARLNTDA